VVAGLEARVSQQPIVRHYRGGTRAEVESAYRADAQPAIAAGYLPVGHIWSQDAHGLLLAVTYQLQSAPVPAAPAGYQAQPQYGAQPQYVAQPQHQPTQFAPATNGSSASGLDSQWLAPVAPAARYQPPPEMYAAPPDMYAPVGAPVAPAPAAPAPAAPASVAPAPTPLAAPAHLAAPSNGYEQHESASSRQTRLTVQTMDLHTAGEPLRLIRSGFPDVPHMPVLERRRWVLENADYVRRAIIQEPRGHRDMYGAILLPPYNDYADMTVLFMHNEGYSTMCGHGIIAITTGLIEEGLFPATEPVTTIRYEVPAGIVAANAATVQLDDGSWAVRGVRFTNVPAYLAAQSLAVRPDGVQLYGPSAQYGALSVDISFGGAYYGIVNAADLGLRVVPEQTEALRHAGAAITEVLRRDHTPQHPTDPALGFIYGTIIVDMDPRTSPDGRATDAHLRNVTVFADAEVDRSPCGSGTSALLAQLHARGRMRVGQEIVNAGITGEHFLGRIEAETALGPYRAVSTSIAGTAYVTGYSTFVVDSRDPLGDGFLLS
jgi:trans-L-3-hydroxyproline dehydratase